MILYMRQTIHVVTKIYSFKPLKSQAKLKQTTLLFFYFYLSKKIWLDDSCESTAKQRMHMKYRLIFSEKQ